METVAEKAAKVKEASAALYTASREAKDALLLNVAKLLDAGRAKVLSENAKDMEGAKTSGLSEVMLDRLLLNDKRLDGMIAGLKDIISLPDPVGEVTETVKRPNGMTVERMRVPLGVIGIIYEARPNVTIDASALALKSGNALLLKGGSEAINSNRKLVEIMKQALNLSGFSENCVEFIDTADRAAVLEMVKQKAYLDVIIPRGGRNLIDFILENSSVPVITHGEGNCHVYVHEDADLKMAEEIVFNAKVQRPSVCNAAEKLLVSSKTAKVFLPVMAERLKAAGVSIKGDEETRMLVKDSAAATEEDWKKEYSCLMIAVKVVSGLDEAIKHINHYGSHHSDAIVTTSKAAGEKFLREVDSAAVFVNASTRFNDGFEFGLGAEMGISTQKLHARGPMGLKELTSLKFVVRGSGQVRK